MQGNVKASVEIASTEGTEETWRLSARVGNRMNCQLRMEGGKLVAGPVMSTRNGMLCDVIIIL